MSENRREYQKAIDYLSDQIRAGTLTVGSRLPTERAIAEALGISRNSTREALRTMENMGMIESKQGSGHYLTGSISNSLSGMIRMMLLLNRTSQKEICAVRRSLEKCICQFAADQPVSPAWQLEAERLLNQEGADIEEEIENDRKFHYLLVEASHNNLFFELMNAITDVYREWIDFVIRYAPPEVKGALKEAHREILTSILTHDRQRCEAAIDRHYDIIERRIQEG